MSHALRRRVFLLSFVAGSQMPFAVGFAQGSQERATETWGWRNPETVSAGAAYQATLSTLFTFELISDAPVDDTTSASAYLRSVSSLSQETANALESYGRTSLNELMQRQFQLVQLRCQSLEEFESKADYVERLREDEKDLEILRLEHFDRALELLDEQEQEVFRGLVSGVSNWVMISSNQDMIESIEATTQPLSALVQRDCDFPEPPAL